MGRNDPPNSKKVIVMEKKYEVLKSYLQEVNFNANDMHVTKPDELGGEPDANIELSFNVKYTKADGKPLYKITYTTIMNAVKNHTATPCFIAKIVYVSLVSVLDDTMEDEECERILKGVVTDELYNHVRVFAWNLLAQSQYPPCMLPEHPFLGKTSQQHSEEEECEGLCASVSSQGVDEDDDEVDVDWESVMMELDTFLESDAPLNYTWMQSLIALLEEKFTLVRKLKYIQDHDDSTFEGLAMYKYFYRFLKPVDYSHPDYEGLDEDFWKMLFQLVFAECDEAVLIPKGGGVVDLQCTYSSLGTYTISQCTMQDLKKIMMELTISSVMKTGLSMTCMEIQTDILDCLRDDGLISKAEFKALLGCDLDDALKESVKAAEDYYARIVNCESQTFPYRFFGNGTFL